MEHVAAWVAERVLPFLTKSTDGDAEDLQEKTKPLAAQIAEVNCPTDELCNRAYISWAHNNILWLSPPRWALDVWHFQQWQITLSEVKMACWICSKHQCLIWVNREKSLWDLLWFQLKMWCLQLYMKVHFLFWSSAWMFDHDALTVEACWCQT